MNVITTAHWLEQHILRHYSFQPKRTFCVISGLDKSLWKPVPRDSSPGRPGRSHFLVEGPASDPRKNVAPVIRLLEELGLDIRGSAPPSTVRLSARTAAESRRMSPIADAAGLRLCRHPRQGLQLGGDVRPASGDVRHRGDGGGLACPGRRGVHDRSVQLVSRSDELVVSPGIGVLELVETPTSLVPPREALATAKAWPTWEDQADQIFATIESLVPFGRSRWSARRRRIISDRSFTLSLCSMRLTGPATRPFVRTWLRPDWPSRSRPQPLRTQPLGPAWPRSTRPQPPQPPQRNVLPWLRPDWLKCTTSCRVVGRGGLYA